MLTADDTPTIRFAITRRLDKETGISVADIQFQKYAMGERYRNIEDKRYEFSNEPFVRVGLLLEVGPIIAKSVFDLPVPFEHGHLIAEIDEIAEAVKVARKDFFTAALPVSEEKTLPGTGLRGRWKRYG